MLSLQAFRNECTNQKQKNQFIEQTSFIIIYCEWVFDTGQEAVVNIFNIPTYLKLMQFFTGLYGALFNWNSSNWRSSFT